MSSCHGNLPLDPARMKLLYLGCRTTGVVITFFHQRFTFIMLVPVVPLIPVFPFLAWFFWFYCVQYKPTS